MTDAGLAHRARLLAGVSGRGLEIGAFHKPLPVPEDARVTYVDAFPPAVARRYFPEIPGAVPIVTPDIVAPAESLPMVADRSQDFVLASHLLEHLPDPIAGLQEWYRVLRPGGLLVLCVPDMRRTFDVTRPRTDLGHLLADHREPADAPARSARDLEHYRSWARAVNHLVDPRQVDFWARLLQRIAYPIHFHCWIDEDLVALLGHLATEGGVRFEIERFVAHPELSEFAFRLRARESAARTRDAQA